MLSLEQIISDPSACANPDTVKWLADQLYLERQKCRSTVSIVFRNVNVTDELILSKLAYRILQQLFNVDFTETPHSFRNELIVQCPLTTQSCEIDYNMQWAIGRLIADHYCLPGMANYMLGRVIAELYQTNPRWVKCYEILEQIAKSCCVKVTDNFPLTIFNVLDIIKHMPECRIDLFCVTITSTAPPNVNEGICVYYSDHYTNYLSLENEALHYSTFSDAVRNGKVDEFVTTLATKIDNLIGGISNAEFADQVRDKLVQFLITQNSM